MKRIASLLFAFIPLFLSMANGMCCRAQGQEGQGRVLFISSDSYGQETVQLQIEGLMEGLEPWIAVDYEFMDVGRMDLDAARRMLHGRLAYSLSATPPYDVIVAGGDAALQFVMDYREELFADVPVVFEGVGNAQWARELAARDPLVTGVLEEPSLPANIDLVLELKPETGRLVAVLDDSPAGAAQRERFYQAQGQYPGLSFEEVNVSECTTPQLRARLQQLGGDAVLVFFALSRDKSGKTYTGPEAVRTLAEYAKVPVIRMVDSGIEEGLLGGYVVSMRRSGMLAGQMAALVVKGRAPARIEVADSPNLYYINEEVMRRYGLDMRSLPKDAVIVNHEVTFFEKYDNIIVPVSVFAVAMAAILVIVVYDNLHRRKLLAELEEARKILESASQHDFLTGLPNRSRFMEDLTRTIGQGTPCTVIMLDIDEFKSINDVYGHEAGDEALKQLADRMKAMQSNILTPYRYAGDEFFMILLSEQGKMIEKIAHGCRQIFFSDFVIRGAKRRVTGSIGIATYPKDAAAAEQLIICADKAMYQVKKSGKNEFAYYGQETETEL